MSALVVRAEDGKVAERERERDREQLAEKKNTDSRTAGPTTRAHFYFFVFSPSALKREGEAREGRGKRGEARQTDPTTGKPLSEAEEGAPVIRTTNGKEAREHHGKPAGWLSSSAERQRFSVVFAFSVESND